MNEKKITQDKDTAADININAAEVTLPFAQPRIKLLAEYVPNAVPRSGSYQQWLTEHYDMAYSLGLEKGAGDEARQGDGLMLNPTTKKLAVKHNDSLKTPGGILGLNTAATSGLVVSTAGVAVGKGNGILVSGTTVSAQVNTAKGMALTAAGIELKPHATSGLVVSNAGVAVGAGFGITVGSNNVSINEAELNNMYILKKLHPSDFYAIYSSGVVWESCHIFFKNSAAYCNAVIHFHNRNLFKDGKADYKLVYINDSLVQTLRDGLDQGFICNIDFVKNVTAGDTFELRRFETDTTSFLRCSIRAW